MTNSEVEEIFEVQDLLPTEVVCPACHLAGNKYLEQCGNCWE